MSSHFHQQNPCFSVVLLFLLRSDPVSKRCSPAKCAPAVFMHRAPVNSRAVNVVAVDPHPGNVAVDSENGGRLIYYDFGMMGTIPGDVRGGLLELFYGVYNKNADKCLDALVTMGVLVSDETRRGKGGGGYL